jgi:hypothetical protein
VSLFDWSNAKLELLKKLNIGVRNAKSCFLDIGKMSRSRVLMQPVLYLLLFWDSFCASNWATKELHDEPNNGVATSLLWWGLDSIVLCKFCC